MAVIEFTQFRALLKEKEQSTDADELIFYDNIPRSSIVHDTALTEEMTACPQQEWERIIRIATALDAKYIRRHAELEINLACASRNRWNALLSLGYSENNVKAMTAQTRFVIEEMLKYLRESYIRFEIARIHQ